MGKDKIVEKVVVKWTDGTESILKDIYANQVIVVAKTKTTSSEISKRLDHEIEYKDITSQSGINFGHKEDQYNDFAVEPLLRHRNSAMGPALTVADINNDGLEDIFVGNATGSIAALFVQKEDATFEKIDGPWIADKEYEDTGALFFDADNDGDQDLYIASGGNDPSKSKSVYQDRLYINNEGVFVKSKRVLPTTYFKQMRQNHFFIVKTFNYFNIRINETYFIISNIQ